MKLIILSLMLLVSLGFAQNFDGAGLSMAGNYSALSRGINSMAYNPANLAVVRNNAFELNLISLDLALYNNSFSTSDYNRYFTQEGHNGKWDENDRENILDLIPESGLGLFSETGVNALGFAINNFGLSIQSIAYSSLSIFENKQLLETSLFGQNFDRNYQYKDDNFAKGEAMAAVKISFGYAYRFDNLLMPYLKKKLDYLAVGLNYNSYIGIGIAKINEASILIDRFETPDGESIKYRMRNDILTSTPEGGALGGSGMGLDFGLSARYNKDWLFSLSFNNLFSSINWMTNCEQTIKFTSDSASTNDIYGDREDYIQEEDSTYSINEFSTSLPTAMRAAAAWRMLHNLTFTAEWEARKLRFLKLNIQLCHPGLLWILMYFYDADRLFFDLHPLELHYHITERM